MRRKLYPWRQRPAKRADKKTKPQPFRMHPDGLGYDALRPTKGWLRVSAKRLRARAFMTFLNDRVIRRRLGATSA